MACKKTYSSRNWNGRRQNDPDVVFDKAVVGDVGCEENPPSKKSRNKGQTKSRKKAQHKEFSEQESFKLFQNDDLPKTKKSRRAGKKTAAVGQAKKKQQDTKSTMISNEREAKFEIHKSDKKSEESFPSLNIEECTTSSNKRSLFNDKQKKTFFNNSEHKINDGEKPSKTRQMTSAPNKNYVVKNKENLDNSKPMLVDVYDEESQEADNDELPSIEIARDASVIPLSELLPKRPSSIYNLASSFNLFPDSFEYGDEQLAWVSVSSGCRSSDNLTTCSTYVSTYTYGSTTAASAGTETNSESPPILWKKKKAISNSTLKRGKHSIDKDPFPQFISPINWSQGKRKKVHGAAVPEKSSSNGETRKRMCSTKFLESESNTDQLETIGLSAIPSRTAVIAGSGEDKTMQAKVSLKSRIEPMDKRRSSTSKDYAEPMGKRQASTLKDFADPMDRRQASTPKDCADPLGKRQTSTPKDCADPLGKRQISTPKDCAEPFSLNISPLKIPSWNDEDGPQVFDDHEDITSEIIVASFIEPTILLGEEKDEIIHQTQTTEKRKVETEQDEKSKKSLSVPHHEPVTSPNYGSATELEIPLEVAKTPKICTRRNMFSNLRVSFTSRLCMFEKSLLSKTN